MGQRKYFCVMATMIVMMMVKLAYSSSSDDFGLPEEGKRPEAQKYFELIPIESKLSFNNAFNDN